MIKAVVFDLDNTLVDFMRMKTYACEEAMSAMIGAGLDLKQADGMKILYKLYDEVGIEDKEIFQKFLKKSIGKIDWKILAAGIVAYRRIKSGYLVPYPRVMSTLLTLKQKGIKISILSDAPRMRAWTRLASSGLSDFFDVVVTFDDTKHHKPHKKAFDTILAKLKLPPDQVLMVGDWPARDIAGAKRAGMKTAFAKYGCVKPGPHVKADRNLNSIDELVAIVDSL